MDILEAYEKEVEKRLKESKIKRKRVRRQIFRLEDAYESMGKSPEEEVSKRDVLQYLRHLRSEKDLSDHATYSRLLNLQKFLRYKLDGGGGRELIDEILTEFI